MKEGIRSILVDDEVSNRLVLTSMLNRYCPSVEVVGEADSALSGYKLINELQPDLVFLDVKMPVNTGFDMLRMFETISFRIVFITAHDEFAVRAFEFSAMDYLLKPIDYTKLIKAVDKVQTNILQNRLINSLEFVDAYDEKTNMMKSISLHNKDKVVLVNVDKISYIEADRNYCEVVTDSNERFTSSKTLSEYELMLMPCANFLRINKSVIINVNYLQDYSKGAICFINMLHCPTEMEVSRRKKADILNYLKKTQVS